MLPKITVLMTVFDGEKYLKECIDSVLNQSFKDFEFLIVDDCSIGPSLNIIESYRDRIHIIKNEKNLGQVKSLNIGLNYARGKYIARVDQDDIMLKDRLKRQADFLDRRPEVCVVGTWGYVIDEKGKIFAKSRFPIKNEEIIGTVLFGGYFLMHPSAMFRRQAVVDMGGYDEFFLFAEDYELWTRILLKKYRIENMPEYLIKFRYHKASSSNQFLQRQRENARRSVFNFISALNGVDKLDLEALSILLTGASTMNKGHKIYGMDSRHFEKAVNLLDVILNKAAGYFNLKKNQRSLMRKVFCNRMLNFLYGTSDLPKKGLELYLFCLRNFFYLYTNPKLYLYPVKSIL